MTLLFVLGLANWIATTIIVESALFRPLRDLAHSRSGFFKATPWTAWVRTETCLSWRQRAWEQVRYLLGCHMCVGVWVAFAEVAATRCRVGSRGLAGFVVAALAVKAIGHLVLELRPQAWWSR